MGQTNVFQQAQTYGSLDANDDEVLGDRVLFYPGTDTRFPADIIEGRPPAE